MKDIENSMLARQKVPSIDIVRIPEGGYTTLDNSRLFIARENEIDISANIHNYNERLPEGLSRRFGHPSVAGVYAETWGEALEYRIMKQSKAKQSKAFREAYYPIGTYTPPKVVYPSGP